MVYGVNWLSILCVVHLDEPNALASSLSAIHASSSMDLAVPSPPKHGPTLVAKQATWQRIQYNLDNVTLVIEDLDIVT